MLPVPVPGPAGANQANANQNGAQPALNNGLAVNGNQQAPLGIPGFGANAQGLGFQPLPPNQGLGANAQGFGFQPLPPHLQAQVQLLQQQQQQLLQQWQQQPLGQGHWHQGQWQWQQPQQQQQQPQAQPIVAPPQSYLTARPTRQPMPGTMAQILSDKVKALRDLSTMSIRDWSSDVNNLRDAHVQGNAGLTISSAFRSSGNNAFNPRGSRGGGRQSRFSDASGTSSSFNDPSWDRWAPVDRWERTKANRDHQRPPSYRDPRPADRGRSRSDTGHRSQSPGRQHPREASRSTSAVRFAESRERDRSQDRYPDRGRDSGRSRDRDQERGRDRRAEPRHIQGRGDSPHRDSRSDRRDHSRDRDRERKQDQPKTSFRSQVDRSRSRDKEPTRGKYGEREPSPGRGAAKAPQTPGRAGKPLYHMRSRQDGQEEEEEGSNTIRHLFMMSAIQRDDPDLDASPRAAHRLASEKLFYRHWSDATICQLNSHLKEEDISDSIPAPPLMSEQQFFDHGIVLEGIIDSFKKHNVKIKPSKAFFFQSRASFLGQQVSHKTRIMDPSRVQAFQEWPLPFTIEQLHTFTATATFWSSYVPKLVQTIQPLVDQISKKNKKSAVQWDANLTTSFEAARRLMCKNIIRYSADPSKKLYIMTDGSTGSKDGNTSNPGGIAGAMFQLATDDDMNSEKRPLAFYSKKLTISQGNWAAIDVELFAIVVACEKWEYHISGRNVVVLTDHKNILHIVRNMMLSVLSRTQRMVAKLAQSDITFEHVEGKKNFADGPSRSQTELANPDVSSLTALLQVCQFVEKPTKLNMLRCIEADLISEACEDTEQEIYNLRIETRATESNTARSKCYILCSTAECQQWRLVSQSDLDRFKRRGKNAPFSCDMLLDRSKCLPKPDEDDAPPRPASTSSAPEAKLSFTKEEAFDATHNSLAGHIKCFASSRNSFLTSSSPRTSAGH